MSVFVKNILKYLLANLALASTCTYMYIHALNIGFKQYCERGYELLQVDQQVRDSTRHKTTLQSVTEQNSNVQILELWLLS